MKTWKEKILKSDAGLARPDLAEGFIAETEKNGAEGSDSNRIKNGAEVLELSPLVGSPSQVSRSPAEEEKKER